MAIGRQGPQAPSWSPWWRGPPWASADPEPADAIEAGGGEGGAAAPPSSRVLRRGAREREDDGLPVAAGEQRFARRDGLLDVHRLDGVADGVAERGQRERRVAE